jgi:hypothetical protein
MNVMVNPNKLLAPYALHPRSGRTINVLINSKANLNAALDTPNKLKLLKTPLSPSPNSQTANSALFALTKTVKFVKKIQFALNAN